MAGSSGTSVEGSCRGAGGKASTADPFRESAKQEETLTDLEAPALIDTSVIVRYLTGDPPELAVRAAAVIDSGRELVLSEVALVDAAYVLTKVYEAPHDDAVTALESLVQLRNMRLVGLPKSLVLEALSLCRGSKRHSFADAILWATARHVTDSRVVTFDRRFPSQGLKLEGFV